MNVDTDVIVVGSGPTGMMLAAELALSGVDVTLVERRPDQALLGVRALGLSARTIEVLEQRGLADRFLEAGTTAQVQHFGDAVLDLADCPTRHPYGLSLWQVHTERLLAGWVDELPVRRRYGRTVIAVEQDEAGVTIRFDDETMMRARYVVGCDGGRSLVRRQSGIGFSGWDATTSYMLCEATMPDDPAFGFEVDDQGRHALGPIAGEAEGRVRFVVQERPAKSGDEPSLDEVRAGVLAVWGTDFGLHSPTWITRFSDAARQADAYRRGRVFVAGDAAHVHSPVGGQGLNTGVQDAVNLGWKLGRVIRGLSSEALLDTYHAERHPVGARVLQGTMATTMVMGGEGRTAALRETLAPLLEMDGPRRLLAARFSGLDIHYGDAQDGRDREPAEGDSVDIGGSTRHPLVGRRVPDLDLDTADGPTTIASLLHDARPVLIHFGDPAAAFDLTPWAEVRRVDARSGGAWELPVIGVVDAPAAVLVRPDGHVAWVGSLDDAALPQALDTWFGVSAS